MDDTGFVHLEINLTGFHLFHGLGHIHGHGTGLGIRHQATGTEHTAQRTHLGHDGWSTDDHVNGSPSVLDLLNVLIQTGHIGTGCKSFFALGGVGENENVHCTSGAMRQAHDPTYHLRALLGVNTQPNSDVHRGIEFCCAHLLHDLGRFLQGVLFCSVELGDSSLTLLGQICHVRGYFLNGLSPCTVIPILRAVPATMLMALSSVKQFRSGILSRAMAFT